MGAFLISDVGDRSRSRAVTMVLSLALLIVVGSRFVLAADSRVSDGLSVQFTDNFLHRPDWRERLKQAVKLGATVVRIDINWPWIEREAAKYDWTLYDKYTTELSRLGLRPLFILNRPNPLHGSRYKERGIDKPKSGILPPRTPDQVAAFARWATAAAERYRSLRPIWELWNEPDEDGFWPPKPDPKNYVNLAREACLAIKKRVPDAFVTGPAAAQMPTVWRSEKPLIRAVLADTQLLACLDAISLHTHRFGQSPETVSRDYAVLRNKYLDAWPTTIARKPIIDTEWGDSVYRAGISEETQALWLPRMFLINMMENVPLTNWYCLMDVGSDNNEMEDRFGLIREDGTRRLAYRAYQTMARQIGTMTLRETVRRFDPDTLGGSTVLRFCDGKTGECKLVIWTNEQTRTTEDIAVSNWRSTGPVVDHLGEISPEQPGPGTRLIVRARPSVQYIPIAATE